MSINNKNIQEVIKIKLKTLNSKKFTVVLSTEMPTELFIIDQYKVSKKSVY